jgi:hypothetical protein
MRIKLLFALSAVVLFPVVSHAQAPAEWRDSLADHMAGIWKLDGQLMGREAHHEVHADWVLNHQFLRLHEKTAAEAPKSEQPYEAFWFLGYDRVSGRYVLHLMDIFGARYSETLGYGTRDGNQIHFVFDYPDGPFHTTFIWNPQKDTWEWLMEQKGKSGKWTRFADLKLTRVASH